MRQINAWWVTVADPAVSRDPFTGPLDLWVQVVTGLPGAPGYSPLPELHPAHGNCLPGCQPHRAGAGHSPPCLGSRPCRGCLPPASSSLDGPHSAGGPAPPSAIRTAVAAAKPHSKQSRSRAGLLDGVSAYHPCRLGRAGSSWAGPDRPHRSQSRGGGEVDPIKGIIWHLVRYSMPIDFY